MMTASRCWNQPAFWHFQRLWMFVSLLAVRVLIICTLSFPNSYSHLLGQLIQSSRAVDIYIWVELSNDGI